MSSRSFRRRNSRRRRRQGPPGSELPGSEGGLPAQGGVTDSAGAGNAAPQGHRGPGRHQGGRPQGGRPQGGRGEGGRQQSARQAPAGRQPPDSVPEPVRREPAVPIVLPDCPVCGKPVRELVSALTHRVARQPAHFDCVVRELRESNEVAPQEKICYLGGGSFGILEFRPSGGSPRFVIRKRIQYEEKETPQEWKKPLQVNC
jgi:hypothetical protein